MVAGNKHEAPILWQLVDGFIEAVGLGVRKFSLICNQVVFVTYDVDLEETSPSTVLRVRVAFEGTQPQSYDVLIDGSVAQMAILSPPGGFGYLEKEWKSYSVPLGRVLKGHHTLTIKPVKSWQVINIDCFALGRKG